MKNYYKMIATDFSKQHVIATDPNAIQQINFTGNLAWSPITNTAIFLIFEVAK